MVHVPSIDPDCGALLHSKEVSLICVDGVLHLQRHLLRTDGHERFLIYSVYLWVLGFWGDFSRCLHDSTGCYFATGCATRADRISLGFDVNYSQSLEYHRNCYLECNFKWSVRLSIYFLQIGTSGMAWTISGIAVRIAQSLGLHKQDPEELDLAHDQRNLRWRIWFVAYTLDA